MATLPLADRLVSLYDEPPAPPTRRRRLTRHSAALNRERSLAEQEAAARERSAAAEEARLSGPSNTPSGADGGEARIGAGRSATSLPDGRRGFVLRHRAGDRRLALGGVAVCGCEADGGNMDAAAPLLSRQRRRSATPGRPGGDARRSAVPWRISRAAL